jgi:hypothetical protein
MYCHVLVLIWQQRLTLENAGVCDGAESRRMAISLSFYFFFLGAVFFVPQAELFCPGLHAIFFFSFPSSVEFVIPLYQ